MARKHKKRIVGWLMAFMMLISVFPSNIAYATNSDDSGAYASDDSATPSQAGSSKDETIAEDETEAEGGTEVTDETQEDVATPSSGSASAGGGISSVGKVSVAGKSATPPMADKSKDKTNELKGFTLKVTQNGSEIPEDGTIESGASFRLEVGFEVPVAGYDPMPANPILKGDEAFFDIFSPSDSFELLSSAPIALRMPDPNGHLVGHVYFIEDADRPGVMQAHVVFDGDDEVFEEDPGYYEVMAQFKADFEYTGESITGEEQNNTVTILDKEYTIHVPEVKTVYEVTKKATPDMANKKIQWEVDITATRNKKEVTSFNLQDYKFYDDLSDVGDYIPYSLTVNGSQRTPDEGTNIQYTFKEGENGPAKILFETEIRNEEYYAQSASVKNTAVLKDDTDVSLDDGEATVNITPTWIKKSGKAENEGSDTVYNPTDRTITWTIIANQITEGVGADLTDVIITDLLPKTDKSGQMGALEFQKVTMKKWDSSKGDWEDTASDISSQYNIATGELHFPSLNKPILLEIVTKVPNDGFLVNEATYVNSASITWAGGPNPGYGSGNIGVGLGYNGIKKDGIADQKTQTVHWTVNVNTKGQTVPDLKVYDLLMYGSSDASDITVDGVAGKIVERLTPRYNQKIDGTDGDFKSDPSGAMVQVLPVMRGGQRVGDLLVVTDLSGKDTLTFDTKITNPDIYAANKKTYIYNTAVLFSGETMLTKADKTVSYESHLLDKEMLKREAMADPETGVNDITNTASEGFDYKEKAAIFRLSINANGLDFSQLTDANGASLGKGIVTDELPLGWEFAKFADGSDYLVFEGNKNLSGGVVTAKTPAVTVADLTADFTDGTETTKAAVKFTFDSLNKPYVILVKAKPTNSTFMKYLDKNGTTTETNTVRLGTESWNGVSDTQDVTVDGDILTKTVDSAKAKSEGELGWTVEYRPFDFTDLPEQDNYLEDTLSPGMELRTDSKGTILVNEANNITAYEMEMGTDGKYTVGNPLTLVVGKDVIYDNTARTLRFNIPDGKKAYRFKYMTDITADTGSLTNHVELHGVTTTVVGSNKQYAIQSSEGSASGKRGGLIYLSKTDGSGIPLGGAEFTLYATAEDGSRTDTVIRTGSAAGDGSLKFRAIPIGEYILKETKSPVGFELDDTEHSVVISQGPDKSITATVDGTAVSSSNPVKIKNYADDSVGRLTVSKIVDGYKPDTTKQFEFTVILKSTENGTVPTDYEYDYIKNGKIAGRLTSADNKISLADKESVTILGLPIGAGYTVTEKDYTADGYVTESLEKVGTIAAGEQTAEFVNTKVTPPGSLTIKKTVAGDGISESDKTKKFDFEVIFESADGTYEYTGVGDGLESGTIKSGDTISLTDGQSITITGLPDGAKYTVTEVNSEGYEKTSTGEEGTISAEEEQTASFINTKNKPDKPSEPDKPKTGKLTISKTVSGSGASTTKAFTFTVTLNGAEGTYEYTGNGISDGTIKSGDTIFLAHGQSITIKGLPEGATYSVTETNYSGYKMESAGAEGTISAGSGKTAAFTNTRTRSSSSGGGGSSSGGGPKVVTKTPGSNVSDATVETPAADDGSGLLGAEFEKQDPTGLLGASVNRTPKTGDDGLRNIWLLGLAISVSLLLVSTGLRISVGVRDRRRRK